MAGDLRVNARLTIPAAELSWRFSRSSGPGGQSVNTSDSRAELSFDVAGSPTLGATYRQRALERLSGRLVDGVLTVSAQAERSQLQNREAALARLGELLAEAVAPPPPPRRPTKPTRAAKQRRLEAKKQRGQTKQQRRRPPPDD
ncbi:MAG TPA: alternative ribosome rescue aminoacyl-tRNA hydrolase ArfB [Mycobacteriales bacterium]|nr:alternative ribosome rescue aminoacyl-tRNA hydrolase ArfB [Mycobacteriales bacterium]